MPQVLNTLHSQQHEFPHYNFHYTDEETEAANKWWNWDSNPVWTMTTTGSSMKSLN